MPAMAFHKMHRSSQFGFPVVAGGYAKVYDEKNNNWAICHTWKLQERCQLLGMAHHCIVNVTSSPSEALQTVNRGRW
ncbi:hypothetical protein BDR07DRAFT_47177 [Suillus spraguei]|nr:hypothetical protein BDR07DRAFT_47177 [Suillus spraguei]